MLQNSILPPSAREKRVAIQILFAFLALVSAPYLLAFLLTPPNMVWSGLLFSADDQNVHLMWARQARDGAFFSRDLFTTEGLVLDSRPLFFNLLTLFIGLLWRLTGLEGAFWYHIFRVGAAALALWQLHELSRAATKNAPELENARLSTLGLAAFTLGAGFVATLAPELLKTLNFLDRADNAAPQTIPMVPEAFLLTSALFYPLNIVSLALLAFLFRALISQKWPIQAFFAALLLSNVHTYDALPFLLSLGAGFLLIERAKPSKTLVLAFFGALLPVIYQFLVFRGSTEFRLKAITQTLPPPIWQFAISFAPLIILAFCGWKLWRELPATRWLWIWAISTLLMVFAPPAIFPFARKMVEGFQLPLLVLAGLGLAQICKKPLFQAATIAVLSFSPLIFLGWVAQNTIENNGARLQVFMPPLFLAQSQVEALRALEKAPKSGAVLCLPHLGSFVPRATGRFTFLGHWAETLDFNRKLGLVARFYQNRMSRDEARAFLRENRIDYIVESRFERLYFPGFNARNLGLIPVFSSKSGDATTVYQMP